MPIPDFDYKAFATDLAQQATGVIPPEISKPDKDYIVSLVLNFCNMCGEALSNDTEYQYTAEDAYLITQFIGEWAFHKSIDLIHGKIPRQHRDKILQQIAFTVFEIAKQCVKQNMPQADTIKMVENHVNRAYQRALAELQKKGVLTPEQANTAAQMSNLDDMSKQAPGADASDTKILKLVAFAMILRTMPQEKVSSIINRFEKADADILNEYMKMDDLENKLDPSIVFKYLSEIKVNLPSPSKQSLPKISKRLNKLVKNVGKTKIEKMFAAERMMVRKFVVGENVNIPPRIASVVCSHIEDKIK